MNLWMTTLPDDFVLELAVTNPMKMELWVNQSTPSKKPVGYLNTKAVPSFVDMRDCLKVGDEHFVRVFLIDYNYFWCYSYEHQFFRDATKISSATVRRLQATEKVYGLGKIS